MRLAATTSSAIGILLTTKIERAKTTIANSSIMHPVEVEHETDEVSKKLAIKFARTERHSLGDRSIHSNVKSVSSNLLPDICLICERLGPLYTTDTVSRFYHLHHFTIKGFD